MISIIFGVSKGLRADETEVSATAGDSGQVSKNGSLFDDSSNTGKSPAKKSKKASKKKKRNLRWIKSSKKSDKSLFDF